MCRVRWSFFFFFFFFFLGGGGGGSCRYQEGLLHVCPRFDIPRCLLDHLAVVLDSNISLGKGNKLNLSQYG